MADSAHEAVNMNDRAQAFDAWLNLGGKAAGIAALILLLLSPTLVPHYNRFLLKSAKINIMGQDVELVDTATLGKGIGIFDVQIQRIEPAKWNEASRTNFRNGDTALMREVVVGSSLLQDSALGIQTLRAWPPYPPSTPSSA